MVLIFFFPLVDNQQPTISGCPANINVNVELGTTSATVTWIEPTAVDNSGVVNLITRSHAPNSAFPLGTTPVSYVFSDLSNNIAQCGFDVTVTPGVLKKNEFYIYIIEDSAVSVLVKIN